MFSEKGVPINGVLLQMMMIMIVDLYSALHRAPLLHYVCRCIVKTNADQLVDLLNDLFIYLYIVQVYQRGLHMVPDDDDDDDDDDDEPRSQRNAKRKADLSSVNEIERDHQQDSVIGKSVSCLHLITNRTR